MSAFQILLRVFLTILSCSFFLLACSNSNTSDSETGSIVFDIEWPAEVPRSAQALNNPSIDCDAAGVAMVAVDVYEATDLWLNGATFECSAGAGTVRNITSGSNRTIVVNAINDDQTILYQGTITGIAISPGAINDVGSVQLDLIDPYGDSDGDGVTNELDHCPNTPSEAQVDSDGCTLPPASDSDGDGVTDELDSCPNTPSGTQVDANGCPDSDGDGVSDSQDSCPNSPSGDVVGTDGCSILRFTDMGDGTVKDNNSGLIWLKNANCYGTIIDSLTWQTALDEADALCSGECGLTDGSTAGDWRLPTKEEWEAFCSTVYGGDPALVNAAGNGQWTEGDAFTALRPSSGYWSGTEYDSTDAWLVDMGGGNTLHGHKNSVFYVWPVRSEN